MAGHAEARPERVEAVLLALTGWRDLVNVDQRARYRNLFAGPRRAVVDTEGDVDGEDIEAEKAEDRPGADREEKRPGHQPGEEKPADQDEKAGAAERAMRHEQRLEEGLIGIA